MNFFAEQDRARRASRWGLVWFTAGVLGIFVAVDVLVMVIFGRSARSGLPWGVHAAVLALVAVTVLVGWVRRKLELAAGGDAVARMVGGRRLEAGATDLLERRLVNVVEEMAIASGISVPKVYILDQEPGINAFAAGYSPNEAVVAVTRGALEQLNRDQLQGVIGHEFSHILNGDMALNIRLLSWISGLLGLFVLGRFALRIASHADDARAALPLVALGAGLSALGWVGMMFVRIMQAAISRQREFLADASAVQFTRNPDGIGGALRRIAGHGAGTPLEHPNGANLSYLCFGASIRQAAAGLLATHPPLEARIAKIFGRPMAPLTSTPAPPLAEAAAVASGPGWHGEVAGLAPAAGIPVAASPAPASPAPERVVRARRFLDALGPQLADAIHDPLAAQEVAAACLMWAEPAGRAEQLKLLQGELPAPRFAALADLLSAVASLPNHRRLELIELVVPALSQLDGFQRELFVNRMRRLALVDQVLNMGEALLLAVLEFRLSYRYTASRSKPPQSLSRLAEPVRRLLWALAQASGDQAGDAWQAARLALGDALVGAQPPVAGPADGVQLREALEQLLPLKPLDKPRLLAAADAIILTDGRRSDDEALLLRALRAALDVPVPLDG